MEDKERLVQLESRQKTLFRREEETRQDIQELYSRTGGFRELVGVLEKDVEKILENQNAIQGDIQGISRRVNRWFLYTVGEIIFIGLAFMILKWVLFK